MLHDGLPALEDRRSSPSVFLPINLVAEKITLEHSPETVTVKLGDSGTIFPAPWEPASVTSRTAEPAQ
ncbi:MAG: hypothetical protein ACXQT4_01185 [Methanotrichaceae archaeon]